MENGFLLSKTVNSTQEVKVDKSIGITAGTGPVIQQQDGDDNWKQLGTRNGGHHRLSRGRAVVKRNREANVYLSNFSFMVECQEGWWKCRVNKLDSLVEYWNY
jgi:hypothetical protein